MANFKPQKISDPQKELNNGKGEYINGVDIPNADDWNKVIDSQLYTQGLAVNPPDIDEIDGDGKADVEIIDTQDKGAKFKFKNLKGAGIKSLTHKGYTQEGVYTKNSYELEYTDGKTQPLDMYAESGLDITITNQIVKYATSASGTTIPSGGWTTTIPAASQGSFLWTKTTVTYSDGNSAVTYSSAYQGIDGKGAPTPSYLHYLSISGSYSAGSFAVTTALGNHSANEITGYVQLYSELANLGFVSPDVAFAAGYYKTSSNLETLGVRGILVSSSSALGGRLQFLTTDGLKGFGADYTLFSVDDIVVPLGQRGYGIESHNAEYQVGTSGTVAPSGSWVTAMPTVPQGQYLWTRITITFEDGTKQTAYSVSYFAKDGANGKDGVGVNITSQSVTYQTSASGTTIPTGSWTTTIPTVLQGQYLWSKTVVNYSDGKSTTTYNVGYRGVDGTNGTNGKDGKDGADGKNGENGATFTPSVNANGDLSWSNDKGLPNPKTVNIRGKDADVEEINNRFDEIGKSILTLTAESGASLDFTVDPTTYILTVQLKNKAGTVISEGTVDLPLESVVVNGSYDNATKIIKLTLENGNTVDIPVDDIVSGLATTSYVDTAKTDLAKQINALSDEIVKLPTKDYVDTTINKVNNNIPTELSQLTDDDTHRTVTDKEKATWTAKQDALTFDTTPTANSDNPVTSGGVKTELDKKANDGDLADIAKTGKLADAEDDKTHRTVTDEEKTKWDNKQDKLTFDTTPTKDSTNPVTSGGVKAALDTFLLKKATAEIFGSDGIYGVEIADSDIIANSFVKIYPATEEDLKVLGGVTSKFAIVYEGGFGFMLNAKTKDTVTLLYEIREVEE